ncbi:MAG: hypothetical protein HONDAALG_04247 [Gammaproteobacteria bacterium]|nr:hypothetical protein [Gammaproteobacteria bacterium]
MSFSTLSLANAAPGIASERAAKTHLFLSFSMTSSSDFS